LNQWEGGYYKLLAMLLSLKRATGNWSISSATVRQPQFNLISHLFTPPPLLQDF
jgi:hypothetical protein